MAGMGSNAAIERSAVRPHPTLFVGPNLGEDGYRLPPTAFWASIAASRFRNRRMKRFDTVVVGLGAMGSATLCHLAKRGQRVLGIDRFSPPHPYGSSHGETRITRLAIGEGAHYTPLALRSHELWRALEIETGERLLRTNGGLIISSAMTSAETHVRNFFANTVLAAERFGIAHEILDAAQIRRHFTPFPPSTDRAAASRSQRNRSTRPRPPTHASARWATTRSSRCTRRASRPTCRRFPERACAPRRVCIRSRPISAS